MLGGCNRGSSSIASILTLSDSLTFLLVSLSKLEVALLKLTGNLIKGQASKVTFLRHWEIVLRGDFFKKQNKKNQTHVTSSDERGAVCSFIKSQSYLRLCFKKSSKELHQNK